MASTITLKRRIKSISNTKQITKAMELVSASKLRRATEYASSSREYREIAYELLRKLNSISELDRQPLFAERPIKNKLYIVVTSNTGLAGAYNANVLKHLNEVLKNDQKLKIKSHVITIGSKGAQFVRRLQGVDLMAAYPPFPDRPDANDVRPILNTIIEKYKDGSIDDIGVVYTMFKSNLVQEAQSLQLLPAPVIAGDDDASPLANFEPDVETVVEEITTRLLEVQIWQAVLESLASEHAMRMIATRNATDNASELIDDYTLELNTARQAAITQELAEISGGVEALNG
jgi:F-type H+-transporting ATPase subunit gamma